MKKPITLIIVFAMILLWTDCSSKFVEPAAEEFKYNYDVVLKGSIK